MAALVLSVGNAGDSELDESLGQFDGWWGGDLRSLSVCRSREGKARAIIYYKANRSPPK